jgi:hypothetical protein
MFTLGKVSNLYYINTYCYEHVCTFNHFVKRISVSKYIMAINVLFCYFIILIMLLQTE